MSDGLNLPQLHRLLRQLRDVRDQLASGPRQIAAREKRIGQAEQIVVDKSTELKMTRAEIDRKNLDLKSKEQNLHSLRGKLNASSTNREYEILQNQIEADKVAKSVLEDEIIELLDRAEVIGQDIAKAKDAVVQLQKELKQFTADFEAKLAGLKEQESQLSVAVEQAEQPMPAQIRDTYRRLVEAHDSEALANANAGCCSDCFVNLTPQNRVLVNSGKPLFCPSCGRLLYVDSGK